jgi:hypothetical protein
MDAIKAVLRVGGGRGFVVSCGREHVVVTAAHLLPVDIHLGAAFSGERTYGALLGPVGGETAVAAEALFIDPITDLAVLGPPDGDRFPEEYEAYEALIEPMHALAIGAAPAMQPDSWGYLTQPGEGKGKFLTLAGEWVEIDLRRYRYALSVSPDKLVEAGTSGSPILSSTGEAIAVVAHASIGATSGGSPVLTECLPARLLR